MTAERVPFAPVNDFVDALADEQVAYRGLVHQVEHPVSGRIRVIVPPWIGTGAAAEITPPPLLGQHTALVLRTWLGYADNDIEHFIAAGSPGAEPAASSTGWRSG